MSESQTVETKHEDRLDKFPPGMSYQDIITRKKKLEEERGNRLKSIVRGMIVKALNSLEELDYIKDCVEIMCPKDMKHKDKIEILIELLTLGYTKMIVFTDGYVKEYKVTNDLNQLPVFQYIKIYLD